MKQALSEKYDNHITEKVEVCRLKQLYKEVAQKKNSDVACGSFHLQQVICLPKAVSPKKIRTRKQKPN